MEHGSTSLACIFEPTQGEFVFYVCPGSRYIPPEHLPDDYLASARMLFLPGHMLTQDEITCRTLLDALHKARQYHTQIVLDPAKYWLNPDLESFVFDAIAISDLILPNRSEAELLTGCGAPGDAAAGAYADPIRIHTPQHLATGDRDRHFARVNSRGPRVRNRAVRQRNTALGNRNSPVPPVGLDVVQDVI